MLFLAFHLLLVLGCRMQPLQALTFIALSQQILIGFNVLIDLPCALRQNTVSLRSDVLRHLTNDIFLYKLKSYAIGFFDESSKLHHSLLENR